MTGMPVSWLVSWSEMCGKLVGRFPRPHRMLAPAGVPAAAVNSSSAEVVQRNKRVSSLPARPLPLVNNVTGLNHPPAQRAAARAQEDESVRSSEMGL
eukprot:5742962-Pleurochrysis_carterae.AAC.1